MHFLHSACALARTNLFVALIATLGLMFAPTASSNAQTMPSSNAASSAAPLSIQHQEQFGMQGGTRTLSMLDFMRRLSNWGTWRAHPSFGWVWQPRQLSPTWEPYVLGEWQVAQDGSLYWNSYEPFGWATYHYGRWFYDITLGWNWQPGTEWAPAWVAWRGRPGIVGWAALPPQSATPQLCELGEATGDRSSPNPPDFSWVFVREINLLSSSVQSQSHDAWLSADLFGTWNQLPLAPYRIASARNINLVRVCELIGASPSTPRVLLSVIAATGHSTAGRPFRSVSSPSAARALSGSSSIMVYAPTITGQVPTTAAPLALIQRATPAPNAVAAAPVPRTAPATRAAPASRTIAFGVQETMLNVDQSNAMARLTTQHVNDEKTPPYEGFDASSLPEWQQREHDEQGAINARQQAVLATRQLAAVRAPKATPAAPAVRATP